jgi:hypothetical protein
VCFALSDPLLSIFNITNSDPIKLNNGRLMLMIALLQMPMFGIGIGGMMLFQATHR